MRPQKKSTWNFLSSRDSYVLHLAIVFWCVSAFIQGKLAGNLVPVIGHHVINAELRSSLFSGFGQQDYVAVQRGLQAMQQKKNFQVGGIHAFVIMRATAIDVSIFDDGGERIYSPLVAFYANDIQVPHQQQRLFLSISFEPGDQISPSGSGLINLCLNALCRQHSFNVFSRAGLVSWRIAGVDLYQFHKEFQSFIMGFAEIRRGLLRESRSTKE